MTTLKSRSTRRALIGGGSILAAVGATIALRPDTGLALPVRNSGGVQRQDLNVKQFGAIGDGKKDDSKAIQAALDAVDPNRGGRIFIPQGRYRIAAGLVVRYQGSELVGEGQPGTSRNIAQGSSRIISDDGVTAISCGASDIHGTLGYGFRCLHILAAPEATKGDGIVIKNTASCIFQDVTCSDYVSGSGLVFDGGVGGDNAQYADLFNFSAGNCLTGLMTEGTGPNGIRIFGGYFEGAGVTPQPGSVGIRITTGDTFRAFGTVVQGYETGYYINAIAKGHELHGPRAEYCNVCYHFGSNTSNVGMFGGTASNTLLRDTGAGNIGILIDEGARDCLMMPTLIDGCRTDVIDNGARTRWITGTGTIVGASSPGVVVGKEPRYDKNTGALIGYVAIYDNIR